METSERIQLLAASERPTPDVERALEATLLRHQQARQTSQQHLLTTALVTGTALALLVGTPSVRAWAQEVWAEFRVQRFSVMPVNLQGLPFELLLPNVFPVGKGGSAPQKTLDPAEAGQWAGFAVRLPRTPLLPYQPQLAVSAPWTIQRPVEGKKITAALHKLGRAPIEVPPGLDQTLVGVRFGPSVQAHFGECPQLVGPWRSCAFLWQSTLPVILAPPNVSLEVLSNFSLRLLGLRPEDAQRLATHLVKSPALFQPPSEEYAYYQELRVKDSDALLTVYKPDARGEVAYHLAWVTGERAYSLFGRDPKTALPVAESIQ